MKAPEEDPRGIEDQNSTPNMSISNAGLMHVVDGDHFLTCPRLPW